MKVNALIAASVWKPGTDYGRDQPIVSVLLPTFRRAKSGLFQKAVKSVLNQSLKELELIIIDDASTDGTADQIADFMAQDGRVSCIWHPQNIGLPAISEFEGYQKARGEYLAFQFDDDEFKLDAIEKMVAAAIELSAKFVYGHVDFMTLHPDTGEQIVTREFGKSYRPQTTLQYENYISNNAVLLHRNVVEVVGFYDPNVAMARLCDYDLWRRCAQHFKLHNVDVSVGTVMGPATADSLGHTYAMEKWLSFEWMNLDRTKQLLPKNFGDVDVLAIPPSLAAVSKYALSEMHRAFAHRSRPSVEGDGKKAGDNELLHEGYVLLVVPHSEALSSPFNLPANSAFQRVRLVNGFNSDHCIEDEIIGASAIIIVNEPFSFSAWVNCARALGIPHYLYLNERADVQFNLNGLVGATTRSNIETLQKTFSGCSGIVCATAMLAKRIHQQYFYENARVVKLPLRSAKLDDNAMLNDADGAVGLSALFIGGLLAKHSPAGLLVRESRCRVALRLANAQVSDLNVRLGEAQRAASTPAQVTSVPLVAVLPPPTKQLRFFYERVRCEPRQYAHVKSAASALIGVENEVVCESLLSAKLFREYAIDATAGVIRRVRLPVAFSICAAASAEFGLEILSPQNEITMHEKRPLLHCYSEGLVLFNIVPIKISGKGWRVRVFVRLADTPIYLFERRPRSIVRRLLEKPTPFFDLLAA